MSRAFAPPDTLTEHDTRTIADVRRAVWINGIYGMGAGAVFGTVGHTIMSSLQRKFVGSEEAAAGSSSEAAQAERMARRVAASKATGLNGVMYKILRPLPPLGKNTFLFSLLGGGALGSFVMSTTAGKNAVHLLHPIFAVGKDETAGKSQYQIALAKSQQRQQQLSNTDDINNATTNSATINIEDEDELDAAHHRTRSLRRKASMKHRLETGHSLSGTHSNTWPHDHYTNDANSTTNNTAEEDAEEEVLQKDRAVNRAQAWGRRQTDRREVIRDRIERGNALSDSTGGHWSIKDDTDDGEKR